MKREEFLAETQKCGDHRGKRIKREDRNSDISFNITAKTFHIILISL